MVGAVIQRWLSGHWLHGDVIAGFVHLHNIDHELHGDWSDERYELHVHGVGDEQGGHGFGFDGVIGSCASNGSGCSDGCVWCLR